ncbi:MAG: energy transducer TonB [Bacteroidia bacterium]
MKINHIKYCIAFLVFVALQLNIQTLKAQIDSSQKVSSVVDQPPALRGGYMKYINENLKYPSDALARGIEGKVLIAAVINREGFIEDVRILEDPGAGLGEEAERLFKSMPRWNPAIVKGEPVKMMVRFPVNFKISNQNLKDQDQKQIALYKLGRNWDSFK